VKQRLCLQVLFCSTEVGRTSFVRQLEADFHIDTSLDVVSQLSVCDLVCLFFFGGGSVLMFKFLNSAVFSVLSAVHPMSAVYILDGRRSACSQCIQFSKS
jgi:hypothetical protein